jgi:hypothetical protein
MTIGPITLEKNLIWIMTKIIYIWDVTFTCIDNWQLRTYIKLKEIRDDLVESEQKELNEYLFTFEEDKDLEAYWEEDCNSLKSFKKGE